jgi:hypothetical protein
MTSTKRGSLGLTTTRSLLNRLIELPDLARTIPALPVETFAALVRKIGIEDAGEIIALATTEQLVQAFDEDLFVNTRAGERETLDVARFVVWLEVLLEAGDEVVADRVAELDEDFVAHALSGVVLVLDEDALRERLEDGDEDESRQVDKALESALKEDIDGYIVIAKQHDGWDAALSLILALDRNHRSLLVRLLDRLVRVGSRYLDDLEELSTVLSEGESLGEDVEAARDERRSQQGYVEPQAASAFLALARKPQEHGAHAADRDPLTRAYFRDSDRSRHVALPSTALGPRDWLRALPPAVQRELDEATGEAAGLAMTASSGQATAISAWVAGLQHLQQVEPRVFGERMEEFAYLTNVLLAGHERGGERLRPKAAADAVLATVCYGAITEVHARRAKGKRKEPPSPIELADVLRERSVDLLFRLASSALSSGGAPKVKTARKTGLLYSAEELEAALR